MKKISFLSFLLIIMFYCFALKPKAITNIIGDEYVQIGIGNEEMLAEDGYTLISGEVNWNKVGEYVLTYIDDNGITYEKNVYIIDDEYYFIQNSDLVNFDCYENYEIVEVFYVTKSSFYLVCNYQEIDSTYYDQEKVAVLYYENYKYNWVFRYHDYSRYVDGYFDGENLVITALIYNEDNNYINSILLFTINTSREIRYKEIKADVTCISYGVYMYEGYIYLFTSTKGNKYDYENMNPENNNKIIIFKIIPITLEIVSYNSLDEIENFYVVDSFFYKNRFTINIQFKDTIVKDNITYTNCIYEYDSKLNFVDKYLYNMENKDYKGYSVLDNDICFFSVNHSVDSNGICIQYLNNEVMNKQIIINNGSIYKVNNINVLKIINNTLYISLSSDSSFGSHFLGYAKVDSSSGLTLYSDFEKQNQLIFSGYYFGKIVNTFIINGQYYTRTTDLISIVDDKIVSETGEIHYKKIEMNFNSLQKNSYIKEGNQSKYGVYENINKYIDVFKNTYYFKEIVNTKLNINIINDVVYQCGYKILFNGEGIINGERINEEMTLNDVGKYLLVIKGENVEDVSYNFEISDLTINNVDKKKIEMTIEDVDVYSQVHVSKKYNNYNLEIKEADSNEDLVPFIMSLLLLGLMSLIFVRKKA